MRDTDEVASAVVPVVSELYDLGDRITAVGQLAIRGRESGVEIESPMAWSRTSAKARCEGKMLCVRTYLDRTETLEAVGA